MRDYGDYPEDIPVQMYFTTKDATGAPITLAGSPTVAVYKTTGTTESTAGVTLDVDFDGRTGFHILNIDTTSSSFYSAGSNYAAVLTAGTVSGISQAGTVLGTFSIEKRNAGVAAARVLTALPNAAAGMALGLPILGINQEGMSFGTTVQMAQGLTILAEVDGASPALIISNVGNGSTPPISISQTTAGDLLEFNSTNYLSGTELANLITTGTRGATVLPTSGTILTGGSGTNQVATSSGAVPVYSINANTLTSAVIQDGAFTAAKFASGSLDGKGNWNIGKTGYSLTATTGLGNQTANITGTITTVTNLTNLPTAPANWLTASALAADAVTEIQTAFQATLNLYFPDWDDGLAATDMAATVNKLDTMLVIDGGVYQFTINALENAPSGSGASTTLYVAPIQATVDRRILRTTVGGEPVDLTFYQNTTPSVTFGVYTADGTPVTVGSDTVRLVCFAADGTTFGQLATSGSGITVSGNQITATFTTTILANVQDARFVLRNITDNEVYADGRLNILLAPSSHT